MDDKTQQMRDDLDWYVKLLNALCGEYEEWTFRVSKKAHRCEFGHPIAEGQRYFRKLFGPDRTHDAKLCEDCGVKFLYLLFGTGGGTVELATRLVRKRYGSVLVAMKNIESRRSANHDGVVSTESARANAAPSRAGMSPKWSAMRLSEMRKMHPRAYEKWTDEEDTRLRAGFVSGMGRAELAAELRRQPSAITSRLQKLGLLSPEWRMLKLHVKNRTLTADSLRLAASAGRGTGNAPEPLAVSRGPVALPDALVYELYGLTEEEIRIVEAS
jgi:hypothetical protein